MVQSHSIDNSGNKNFPYDFAACTISKRMKDAKAFGLSFGLNRVPSLQMALQHLVEDNKPFYSNIQTYKLIPDDKK